MRTVLTTVVSIVLMNLVIWPFQAATSRQIHEEEVKAIAASASSPGPLPAPVFPEDSVFLTGAMVNTAAGLLPWGVYLGLGKRPLSAHIALVVECLLVAGLATLPFLGGGSLTARDGLRSLFVVVTGGCAGFLVAFAVARAVAARRRAGAAG